MSVTIYATFYMRHGAAVEVMHKHNVIHHDLKPQNVLLLHSREQLASFNPLDVTLKIGGCTGLL